MVSVHLQERLSLERALGCLDGPAVALNFVGEPLAGFSIEAGRWNWRRLFGEQSGVCAGSPPECGGISGESLLGLLGLCVRKFGLPMFMAGALGRGTRMEGTRWE